LVPVAPRFASEEVDHSRIAPSDAAQLWERWNREFGPPPRSEPQADGSADATEGPQRFSAVFAKADAPVQVRIRAIKNFRDVELSGRLMLRVPQPEKHPRGRPPAVQPRVRFDEIPWRPTGPDRIDKLIRLVRSVRRSLEAIASRTSSVILDLPPSELKPALFVNPDGTATLVPDPYRQFLDDLQRIDLHRIRRCPVCPNRLFYAVRRDQGACSPQCMGVNRIRRFREKQSDYEYNRKLKSAGLKPPFERSKEPSK
jgi:hypothetical protein